MFRAHVLIVRRAKLYYTVSGVITPVGGRPVHRFYEFFFSLQRLNETNIAPMNSQPVAVQLHSVINLRLHV